MGIAAYVNYVTQRKGERRGWWSVDIFSVAPFLCWCGCILVNSKQNPGESVFRQTRQLSGQDKLTTKLNQGGDAE